MHYLSSPSYGLALFNVTLTEVKQAEIKMQIRIRFGYPGVLVWNCHAKTNLTEDEKP